MLRLRLAHTRCSYTVYHHFVAHLISHLYYIQVNGTPLHRTALNGHTAVAQLHLQTGADKDAKDSVSKY